MVLLGNAVRALRTPSRAHLPLDKLPRLVYFTCRLIN